MDRLPEPLALQAFTLSHGMRVLVCPRPGMHRCHLVLNVASGCRDERLPGTAHMLEHLIFRGSRLHPGLRLLSEAFEELGADFNAYTAREVTAFEVSAPAESLEAVAALLGEVMTEPKLRGIAAERDIIREEILADYDADGSLINVDDLLVELFYGEAGRPIAGDPADLAKLTREEIVAFYRAHYAAPNMLLVLAGAVGDCDRLRGVLEAAFAAVPADFAPWRRREMPADYAAALRGDGDVEPRLCVKRYDGAMQSELILGFLGAGTNGPQFHALEMLMRVLDDGMASRLSRRLVEELALVYDAEAFLSTTQESTLAQVRVSCRHRRVPRVLDAVYGILSEIASDGVTDGELQRLRRRVVWEHVGMLDGMSQLVSWLGTMSLQGLPCDQRARCAALCAVTDAEIRAAAGRMLQTMPHIVAVVGDLGESAANEIAGVMESRLGRLVKVSFV